MCSPVLKWCCFKANDKDLAFTCKIGRINCISSCCQGNTAIHNNDKTDSKPEKVSPGSILHHKKAWKLWQRKNTTQNSQRQREKHITSPSKGVAFESRGLHTTRKCPEAVSEEQDNGL